MALFPTRLSRYLEGNKQTFTLLYITVSAFAPFPLVEIILREIMGLSEPELQSVTIRSESLHAFLVQCVLVFASDTCKRLQG